MKAFASWSGGKDCMLAVHRFLSNPSNTVEYLINMCDTDGKHSRSHGISSDKIKEQALCMGIPIIQKPAAKTEYRQKFIEVITLLKNEGITAGIFGDIYLQEHRDWIEVLCSETEIEAIFPLWLQDTTKLMKEFVNLEFKTIVVAINTNMLDKSWAGRIIDHQFLDQISKLENIDPCAENGEYHSFVFDGPLFNRAVEINPSKKHTEKNHYFINI